MKKLLLGLLSIAAMFSCKKDEASQTAVVHGKIKFKIEGTQVEIGNSTPNVYPLARTWGTHFNVSGTIVGYSINGQYSTSPATVNNESKYISIGAGIDSMITGQSYTSNVGVDITNNGNYYFSESTATGTSFTIKITSHHDALISGIFSGTFQKQNQAGVDLGLVNVTDGEFSDIQMTY